MIAPYIAAQGPNYTPERILKVRETLPVIILSSLLWEFSLSGMASAATDLRQVIRDAPRFSKIRGTLAAIKMSFKWVGIESAKFIRLSRTEFEVDIGIIPSELQIKQIEIALSHSAPARGRLVRIFHKDFEKRY